MATSFKPANATKVKAPWDPESIVFGEEGSVTEHVRTNAPWEFYSVTSAEDRATMERKVLAEAYKMAPPWSNTDEQLLAEFDKQLEVIDNRLVEPWNDPTKCPTTLSASQTQKIESYKYEALWEPPAADPKRLEMTRNYKAGNTCPFLRDDNLLPEDVKVKQNRERLATKITPTIAPWVQGNLPAAANTKQVVPKKVTSLWNVPAPPQKQYPFEPSNDPILDNLRLELYNRGAAGIFGLSRKFKIMDDDGSGTLDLHEFKKALKELNLRDLKDAAMGHLFRYFDKDDSGNISYDEFLVGVRGQLNKRREAMVVMAFKIMDTDASGVIEIRDIQGIYNCRFHPDFINNRRTEEDLLREFLTSFEGRGNKKNKDFKITLDEFKEYYSNLSASIDSDDYFELMIRNSWHISGGEGWAANTTNKRVLVTHSDGRQSVQEVKNDLTILSQAANSGKSGKSKEQLMNQLIAKQLQAEGFDIIGIDTTGGTGEGKGQRGLSDQQLSANSNQKNTVLPSINNLTLQANNYNNSNNNSGGNIARSSSNNNNNNINGLSASPRSQAGLQIIMNNAGNNNNNNNISSSSNNNNNLVAGGIRRPSTGSLGSSIGRR